MRPIFEWNLGGRSLELGKRTLVMGIVNVTPDSFSDGGEHLAPDAAVAHALRLLDEGADIVDIGGESTRPGARVGKDNPSVGAKEELRRVLPQVADLVVLVKRELREGADTAILAGIKHDRIVLDPGFGFGKRFEENYPLLKRFGEFHELRFPLLAGVSRKSFIGRALAKNGTDATIDQRSYGTLSAEVAVAMKGAHIIRTHDVKAVVDALKIADVAAS